MSAEQLAYWINERWAIHVKKDIEGQPKPWSTDPVFQRVRFCNVHREDDAVTKWMRENWSTHESPAWWFVLGRLLNYVPTLESIVDFGVGGGGRAADVLPSLEGLRDGLKASRAEGEKIFTSAYTISTCGKKMDKVDYVIGVCREVQQREIAFRPGTLHSMWQSLTEVDGLGSFLAAQVVADMKNTKGHPLENAPDWWSWSAPGPGSLRGLNWFFYPEDMKMHGSGPITASGYDNAIKECFSLTVPHINVDVLPICMQDFQNCLCELSKYMKVKHLDGHVRNKYAGV